ncbi:hypothetical protein GC176_27615 [bacterium]|nr:hypothetical protein [bacterium]
MNRSAHPAATDGLTKQVRHSMWTQRDIAIVETLTSRVRVLSLAQITTLWWSADGSGRVVRRRLRRLIDGGLLVSTTINSIPFPQVERPLIDWHPGDRDPDCEQVAACARSRFDCATRPTEVYLASRRAANLFGSTSGRLPRFDHINQNLLLSEVYVLYSRCRPQDAALWVGGESLARCSDRIQTPDACLVSSEGQTTRLIESAGVREPQQLERFHEHCLERNLPYELW